jgi:hypothetical protein
MMLPPWVWVETREGTWVGKGKRERQAAAAQLPAPCGRGRGNSIAGLFAQSLLAI